MDGSIAVRKISKNGRGAERRLSRGKRSSAESDQVIAEFAKKLRPQANREEPEKEVKSSHPSLRMLDGAYNYFQSQRMGSTGIRQQMRNNSTGDGNLVFSASEYSLFTRKVQHIDPINQSIHSLVEDHSDILGQFMWLTLAKHNMLLYGLGCKRGLLRKVCEEHLQGEDVIELEGSSAALPLQSKVFGDRAINVLLTTIATSILRNPNIVSNCVNLTTLAQLLSECLDVHYGRLSQRRYDNTGRKGAYHSEPVVSDIGPSSALSTDNTRRRSERSLQSDVHIMQQRWGGRYANAHASLYVIVHDIGGDMLRSDVSQQCLAILAACPSVVVIASVDNMNASVLWDRLNLARCCWTYHHVPTYVHHSMQAEFPLMQAAEETNELDDMLHDEHTASNSAEGITQSSAAGTEGQTGYGVHGDKHKDKNKDKNKAHHEASKRVDVVLRSLTTNHNELMKILCTRVLFLYDQNKHNNNNNSNRSSSSSSNRGRSNGSNGSNSSEGNEHEGGWIFGTTFDDLFAQLKSELIVKTKKELDSFLKEFIDHRIISKVHAKHTHSFSVHVELPLDVIRSVAKRT